MSNFGIDLPPISRSYSCVKEYDENPLKAPNLRCFDEPAEDEEVESPETFPSKSIFALSSSTSFITFALSSSTSSVVNCLNVPLPAIVFLLMLQQRFSLFLPIAAISAASVTSTTLCRKMTTQKLPKQISGEKRPSFAFHSISERWPKIVAGIVDKLHRYHHKAVEELGEKGGEDVNGVIAKLSEMRYRMMTDKPLEPIASQLPDAQIWNSELDALKKNGLQHNVTWYNGPWLFVECYMYRHIRQFFQQTQFLQNFDPFNEDKQNSYRDSSKYMLAIGTELVNEFDKELNRNQLREMVLRLIQISLWGNKCDLSLTGGDPHFMSDTIFHELDELRPNILANDLEAAVDGHVMKGLKQLDIVLDNSGLELFMDLCLGDFCVAKGLVSKVVLHGKDYPWFVSDTMHKDLQWILAQLAAEKDSYLSRLGNRWRGYLDNGTFEFHAHPFWTQSFEYCRMQEKAPDLYQQLAQSSLLIFKGDLNYRKLVADREWPHETPFRDALCGFDPAPLLALRTLKAETVAGLPSESVQKIRQKFGDSDLSWMTSSDYAVVQLAEPNK